MMLRDPRDAVLSNFTQNYSINSAVYHFLELKAAAEFYAAVMRFYTEVGRQLGLDILEVRYEALTDDLEGEARRICTFLDVEWAPDMLNYHRYAKQRDIRTPSYSQVINPIYLTSKARWRHYASQMAPIQPLLAPFVREFGYE
jgi:hypothetical protein